MLILLLIPWTNRISALKEISIDLHTTTTVTNLSIAFYMLSMSIFPLWWSSFSETLGRRTIYITSFMLFTLWAVLSAVAKNIAMLIVMRVLSGGAAASVQAVGAGTIADMWEPKERGRAMGIFYLGPLCGPLFAPIIGGALAEGLGWRSTLWFLVIYGGLMLVLLIFTLPETLKKKNNVVAEATQEAVTETLGENGPADRTIPAAAKPEALQRISTRQSVQIKTKKGLSVLRRFFIDPLSIVLYLRYPAIAMVVYYASITFGSLYVLNISVQQTFSRAPYNFSTLIVGLLYIPNSLGYVLASIFGGRWIDYIMKREAKRAGRYDAKGKLMFRPEDRMRENAWLGALLFPGALIWYGWTADRGVFWFVPMLANFFFGVGSMLIFALATTMLTEFLPSRASSGIALNNFLRNICSFAGAVAAGPWIDAIGNGWVFTILGCVSLISGVVTIVTFRVKGEAWRAKMGEGGL